MQRGPHAAGGEYGDLVSVGSKSIGAGTWRKSPASLSGFTGDWRAGLAARESFLLRTDPKVLEALRKWAADDLRSANAQIDFLLRKALKDSGRLPGAADQADQSDGKK